MAGIAAQGTRRSMCGFAVLVLSALFVITGVADAKSYDYTVTGFEYDALATLTAARAPGCVAGRTASWVGDVNTGPSDVVSLGHPGDGSIDIGRKGTDGRVHAQTEIESKFAPAQHTLVTACAHGGPSDFAATECTDGPAESIIDGIGLIHGGVGNRVKIDWAFRQDGVKGHWVPDIFRCVEPFHFAFGPCKSRESLSAFTDRKFKLPFRCYVQDYTLPPGDYSQYAAISTASGYLKLKRD